jgi:uncharacterized protein
MKILVDRLTETPTELRFDAGDPGWSEVREAIPELRDGPEEPPEVSVRAHRMGGDLYLEGRVDAALDLECSRCLVRYRDPLRESFRLVLEPAGARVPPEPEAARDLARSGMCLGDELEMGWFQGPEIDLVGLVREVVALALPFQPLCRADCRGLCPRCGVDRNVEACGCAGETRRDDPTRPTSPFAALEVLRRRGNEGET